MRTLTSLILITVLFSCQKDRINPYDDPNLDPPQSNDTNYFNNPSSFSSLQNNIFQPYCNNAGCHDGTFEPDFRTIESSYSTLVYQPVIKNDMDANYEFRVKPGESEKSVLYARLLSDPNGVSTFDNNSQVMPLTADIIYDPDQSHPWHGIKNQLIPNIKDWIDSGAKDIFGNLPLEPNNKPEMRGCIAFLTGQTTPLNRVLPRGSIYIPSSASSVDFWFSVLDDIQNSSELTYNKIKFSKNIVNFNAQPSYPLEIISPPIIETGFYQSTTDNFYHKYTLDMSSYNSGDIVFMKIYVQDNVNPVTEIPSNGAEYEIIKHFTFTVL
ncbi:MAG: hypothetical protein VX762_04780 [Bacteroidota bacterium]|nr:hypothetical protein [Bacteroidota bacterium]